MTDDITFEGGGFVLALAEDRLEVAGKKRSRSIMYADIASVAVVRRPKRLVVVTRLGKRHEFVLERNAEAARMAVASRLANAPSVADPGQ